MPNDESDDYQTAVEDRENGPTLGCVIAGTIFFVTLIAGTYLATYPETLNKIFNP